MLRMLLLQRIKRLWQPEMERLETIRSQEPQVLILLFGFATIITGLAGSDRPFGGMGMINYLRQR